MGVQLFLDPSKILSLFSLLQRTVGVDLLPTFCPSVAVASSNGSFQSFIHLSFGRRTSSLSSRKIQQRAVAFWINLISLFFEAFWVLIL